VEISLTYALALAFLIVVWIVKTARVIGIFSDVESLRFWKATPARLEGVLVLGRAKPGRFYIVRSFFKKIFGGEKFIIRARYQVGDADVVCDRFAITPKLRAKDRLVINRLVRDSVTELDVYCNPKDPLDAVILSPSEHSIRGLMVKHIIFTVAIFFSLLVLVV